MRTELSMGVILFALLCGYLPFDNANVTQLYQQILKGDYTFPSHLSEGSKSLISMLLVRDPAKRATMEQVRNHPWLNVGYAKPPEIAALAVAAE